MVRELELKRIQAKFPEIVPQNCVRSLMGDAEVNCHSIRLTGYFIL